MQLVLSGILTLILVIILYLPILITKGIPHLLPRRDGGHTPRGLNAAMTLIFDGCAWATQAVPVWCGVVLCGFLTVGAALLFRRSGTRYLLSGPLAVLATLLLQGVFPPERTWCFLLPFAVLAVVYGIDSMGRVAVGVGYRRVWTAGIGLMLFAGTCWQQIQGEFMRTCQETGRFQEGQAVA